MPDSPFMRRLPSGHACCQLHVEHIHNWKQRGKCKDNINLTLPCMQAAELARHFVSPLIHPRSRLAPLPRPHLPTQCAHTVGGQWVDSAKSRQLLNPLTGEPCMTAPDTPVSEAETFVRSLQAVPKSGLHNPLKNPER